MTCRSLGLTSVMSGDELQYLSEVGNMGQKQSADCWQIVAKSLTDFDESMGRLLNDTTLLDRYGDKWVGVWHGEVQAAEDDLDTLLNALDQKDVPRAETAIHFMETEPPTLIL